jgi:hypothetical protein
VTARRRRKLLTAVLVVAAIAPMLLTTAIWVTARSTAPQRQMPRVPHSSTSAAQPLWSGDTFRIRSTATDLPPYLFSSASGPHAGWLQPHSNTNPDVDGVSVVDDPAGLTSSGPPHGIRKVIKVTTDEQRAFAGRYVRTELRGPELFRPGDDRWVIAELYIPRDTPVMPEDRHAFWTVLSIFGSPYAGSSPNAFHLARNRAGTGNDIVWELPNGIPIWRTPATRGVWHVLARRIEFSSDPLKGHSEIWYSESRPDGSLKTPLARQLVGGDGGVPLTYRRHYATLDPAHNWNGTANHPDLKNYHTANMWPDKEFLSLYFARHRVYDGAVPVEQIDPYSTGLT